MRKALSKALADIDPGETHLILGPDAMANVLELTAFQRADYGGGADPMARGQQGYKARGELVLRISWCRTSPGRPAT